MLTAERRQFILENLRRDGRVVASELSTALNVSEDTIRRDLREMAEARLLQRVHGGALPASPATASYTNRQHQASAAKLEIATTAAQMIRNGQVVILDGGTTSVMVAQSLPPDLRATVITHCPTVALALAEHPYVEVNILGGRLFKHSLVAIGAATIEALHMIRADIYMLGVCSLHPDIGISNQDLEEAHVKRAMIASAAEVIALASAEKINTAANYIVGPLTDLTHLITDSSVAQAALAPYRALGITVIQTQNA